MSNRLLKYKCPGAKRLMLEAQELKDNTEDYCAQPIDDNLVSRLNILPFSSKIRLLILTNVQSVRVAFHSKRTTRHCLRRRLLSWKVNLSYWISNETSINYSTNSKWKVWDRHKNLSLYLRPSSRNMVSIHQWLIKLNYTIHSLIPSCNFTHQLGNPHGVFEQRY